MSEINTIILAPEVSPELARLQELHLKKENTLQRILALEGALDDHQHLLTLTGFETLKINKEQIATLRTELARELLEKIAVIFIGNMEDEHNSIRHLILNAGYRHPHNNVWPGEHQVARMIDFNPEVVWDAFAKKYESASAYEHAHTVRHALENISSAAYPKANYELNLRKVGKKNLLTINSHILCPTESYERVKGYKIDRNGTEKLTKLIRILKFIRWVNNGTALVAPGPFLDEIQRMVDARYNAFNSVYNGKGLFAWRALEGRNSEEDLSCFSAWRFCADGNLEFEITKDNPIAQNLADSLEQALNSKATALQSALPILREEGVPLTNIRKVTLPEL